MNSNMEAGRELDEAVGVALGFEPKIIWGASGDGGKSYYANTSDDGPWWHKHQIEEWIKEHPVCCGETLKLESYESWPRFSTSIADAWRVVEKLQDKGPCVNFIKNKWHCAIGTGKVHENVDVDARTISYSESCVHGWGDTAPLAICRAALLLVQP